MSACAHGKENTASAERKRNAIVGEPGTVEETQQVAALRILTGDREKFERKTGRAGDYAATGAAFFVVLRAFARISRSARTQSSRGLPGAPLRSR